MRRFVEEADRGQWTLLPECLDDFIDGSNPVRVIDVSAGRRTLSGEGVILVVAERVRVSGCRLLPVMLIAVVLQQ
jgi:hypothetical protein